MSKNSLETMYGRFYVYRYTSEYFKDFGGKGGISTYLNSHYSLLLLLAKKYEVHNISELEKKYNDATEKEVEFLKGLDAKNNTDHRDILSQMLQSFINNITSQQLQEILDNLVWDENLQAFQYRGTGYSQGVKDKDIKTTIGNATEYRIPSAVAKRLDKIINTIKSSEKYSQDQKNTFVSKLNELKTKVIKYGNIRTIKEQTGEGIEKITYKGKKAILNSGKKEWEQDFSLWAYSEVKVILSQLMDIDNLNRTLSWKFTELLGHFVGNRVTIAKDEAAKVVIGWIEDWVKHGIGHQKTGANRGLIDWDINPNYFDQDYLASQYAQEKEYVAKAGKNQYSLTPVVQNNAKLDGKTDAVFTVQYEDSKTEKVNLSIKNYDLTSDLAANNISDLSITLQGKSRLLLYLEGAESIHRKFTIHMLNLLSDHEEHPQNDQSANLQNLRGEAIKVLKSQLLYSALTGDAQMKAGLQANVFAVYDKGATEPNARRIKLFDMGSIITECLMNTNAISTRELDRFSSSNPMFKNETENKEAVGSAAIEAAAKLRVTKIMHEARSQAITVGVSKQLLNNIYSLR